MGLGEVALQAGTQIRSPCCLKPRGLRSGRESKANSQADSLGERLVLEGEPPEVCGSVTNRRGGARRREPGLYGGTVWAQPPGLHLNKPAALGKRGPNSHRPVQWAGPLPPGEVSLLQQVGPTLGFRQREVRLAH